MVFGSTLLRRGLLIVRCGVGLGMAIQLRQKKERSRLLPLRRIASVDDVANAIDFLLCRESEFITGHIIPIDGGESI